MRLDTSIIDIGLPKLNERKVARRVRANRQLGNIPLLALTGAWSGCGYGQLKQCEDNLHLVKRLRNWCLNEDSKPQRSWFWSCTNIIASRQLKWGPGEEQICRVIAFSIHLLRSKPEQRGVL